MSNHFSLPPDPPPPDVSGITLQANAINVGGDVVGRDKTTNNITNIIHKFFVGGANEERDRRNRRIMLDKVRTFWVKGVLEQSLHGAALIELGMEYKLDAVQYPWNSVLQRPDHSSQPLLHGSKMIEVFDQEGGELLILGAPGSGKTTMLIDLARDLIARAEQDETLPIPVVFNLSSWAEKHPPLAEWLIEELSFRYDVPKKVGKAWVEKDQVLPLLDGLDEVKLEQRAECVEAINNFRKEHLVYLAVCSRRAEYEALRAQLRLQSAIVLQSLTREQVDAYLENAGEHLASVRALLQHDAALQELAESPLILSIMVLAYRDLAVSSLPTLDTAEKRRQHLFDQYIQRMLERRGVDKHYTPQQVTHWLSWLSRRMVEHGQATFYLEQMQPDWLPIQRQQIAYAVPTRLIIGLLIGLGVGPVLALFSWIFGLRVGLQLIAGLVGGLVSGLLAGLAFGLASRISEIKTVETVRWSWQDAAKAGIFVVLFLGLFVVVLSLISRLSNMLFYVLVGLLNIGLFFGPFFWLVAVLLAGLKIGDEIETKTIPNQGLWSSVRNAILIWLVFGLLGGPVTGLFGGLFLVLFFTPVLRVLVIGNFDLFGMMVYWLCYGLVSGSGIGLVVGLFYGGAACIQHFTLRFILYRNGSIPLNCVHFLDYCAERIFLRKVGGGYIFVHRLLMEHFAGMERDS